MPQVRREDRKGHASCVSGEVCANSVISKIKKLKKTLDTAGVVRDGRLNAYNVHVGSFLPSLGRNATKVYSGRGADIVMQSTGFGAIPPLSPACSLTTPLGFLSSRSPANFECLR